MLQHRNNYFGETLPMCRRTNRPIFVVGSPRSGTSILSWCPSKQPNIIPLEESGRIGDLATHLGIYYQIGIARGDDYSLLGSMDIEKAEFFTAFGRTVNDFVLRHRLDLEKKAWRRAAGPSVPDKCFVPRYRSMRRIAHSQKGTAGDKYPRTTQAISEVADPGGP